MSQQTIQPTSETKAAPAITGEKQAFSQIVPVPQVVAEGIATSKKMITTSIDGVIAFWRALPDEKRRMYTLFGLSLTLSVLATFIARLVSRKPKTEP